jgi:hypothetical protein
MDDRAVLADELQQRGEPQGELIALQLALAALPATAPRVRRSAIERRIAAWLDTHHDAFYGALAPHVNRSSRPDLRYPALAVRAWRAGFADTVWLQATGDGVGLADVVRAVRALPIAREVRRIELGIGDLPAAIAELACAPVGMLRELELLYPTHPAELPRVGLPSLASLAPIAEGLEVLRAGYIAYGELASSTLRTFSMTATWSGRYPRFELQAPALEELNVVGFALDRGLPARYPRLRSLDLHGNVRRGWLARLLQSPHLARFRRIKVGYGLDDSDLEAVVQHADRLGAIDTLDLTANTFSAAAIAAARARVPACVKLPHVHG